MHGGELTELPAREAVRLLEEGELSLPVRDRAAAGEWAFPGPETGEPRRTRTLREPAHLRRRETDLTTGEVHLVIKDDFGKAEDADHGLISGAVARERWSIHPDDPLSARATCHWVDEIARDDLQLRTETSCEMWSDASHFHLKARLEAYENGQLIHARDANERIARDQM